MDPEERVQWVYNAKTQEELIEQYQQWATTYEKDMFQSFDYKSPDIILPFWQKYVPLAAHILDAGAGTGVIGQMLYDHGYRQLIALDFSEGMLAEAAKKGIYAALKQGVLGEELDFATDTFDAVISVGVFTLGHAPASGFDELIRITKIGGHIIFTLHENLFGSGEFPDKLAALEASGQWQLLEVSDPLQATPLAEPDVLVRVLVFKVM